MTIIMEIILIFAEPNINIEKKYIILNFIFPYKYE